MVKFTIMRPSRKRRLFAEGQLDLFAWADARIARSFPVSYPVSVIARRYRVPAHVAAVIASAAGLGAAND